MYIVPLLNAFSLGMCSARRDACLVASVKAPVGLSVCLSTGVSPRKAIVRECRIQRALREEGARGAGPRNEQKSRRFEVEHVSIKSWLEAPDQGYQTRLR